VSRATIRAPLILEEKVRTWGGLLRKLAQIQNDNADRTLLFRGHADAVWTLQTTLERRGQARMRFDDYYRLIVTRVKPQIESFTRRSFEAPSYTELRAALADYDKFSLSLSAGEFPGYSYMAYTRHHGFPSPLLDWTRSPYVAAFFAFAAPESRRVKRRSIYVWVESKTKGRGTNIPELYRLGPYVATHQRHVLQQCDYSMCVTFITGPPKEWRFTPQEDVFRLSSAAPSDEERLWKITIPSSERVKVLRFLDSANLNAYSLFTSEDSLMDTLATREFDLSLPVK
jgi:hypothetical protein